MKITGATKVHLQLSFAEREESIAHITSELAEAYEALRDFNPQDSELPEILSNIRRAQVALVAVREKYMALMDVVRTNGRDTERVPATARTHVSTESLDDEEEEDLHVVGEWSPLPAEALEAYAHQLRDWMRTTEHFEDAVAYGAAYLVTLGTLEKQRPHPIRQNVASLVLMALLRKLGVRYFAPAKGELVSKFFLLLMKQNPIIKNSDYAIRQPVRPFRNLATAQKLPVQKHTVVNPNDPDDVETVFSYSTADSDLIDNEMAKGGIPVHLIDDISESLRERFDVEASEIFKYSRFSYKFEKNISGLDEDEFLEVLPAKFG